MGRRARDRHRRADAEAPRQPLHRRAAQGPLVQMEAGAAHHRRRADVCAAGQRQALVLLFGLHVRRLARRRGRRARAGAGGQVLFRLHRRGAAASSTLSCATTRWTVSGRCAQVEPKLVFEVAFDSVHRSTRHKSGVAMRFPRIHRIRWDKPAEEADRLETLAAMIVE